MLTQRDAMKLIKSTAEAVMESLWMLLIILMNQIEVKAPDQEISVQHAHSLQNLLDHVNSQKERIEELAQSIHLNRSPRRPRSQRGASQSETGNQSDHSWEREEEEELLTEPPKIHNKEDSTTSITSSRECTTTSQSSSSRESSGEPVGSDCTSTGILGQQTSVLGKDSQWEEIQRGVRGSCQLRRVDSSQIKDSNSRDAGLHHLHHGSRRLGTSSSENSTMSESLMQSSMVVETAFEAMILQACRHHMPQNNNHRIDLLEVYASPKSRLTDEVNRRGGRAKRFTFEDGDLSTFAGQLKLLRLIYRLKPRHVWMANECGPWCAWNRFNQMRSLKSYERVQNQQNESRDQLRLSSLVCKIQIDRKDHFHMENPGLSGIWLQPELDEVRCSTKPAFFDQCQFGLKHPVVKEPMQKRTRIQTSSELMFQTMDNRVCPRMHQHVPIEGKYKINGVSENVSRLAAFYPTSLAKRLADVIAQPHQQHVVVPVMIVQQDSLVVRKQPETGLNGGSEENKNKKARVEQSNPRGSKRVLEEPVMVKLQDPKWKALFDRYRSELPKSGIKQWDGPMHPEVRAVQELCPDMNIHGVLACKGREKYMVHPDGLTQRKTVIMNRLTYEIYDLGTRDLSMMSRNQQTRKAASAHIMLCLSLDRSTKRTGTNVLRNPKQMIELNLCQMFPCLRSQIQKPRPSETLKKRVQSPVIKSPSCQQIHGHPQPCRWVVPSLWDLVNPEKHTSANCTTIWATQRPKDCPNTSPNLEPKNSW